MQNLMLRGRNLLAVSAALLLLAAGAIGIFFNPIGKNRQTLNLSFEKVSSSGTPRYWNTYSFGYDLRSSTDTALAGERSLRIRSEDPDGASATPRGMALSIFPVEEEARGKTLRLSGSIKTDSVSEGHAALWLRAETASGRVLVSTRGAKTKGVRGTKSWERHELEVELPKETKLVKFGAGLSGRGTAWFDSLEVELGGKPYVLPEPFHATEEQVEWVHSAALPFEAADPSGSLADLAPATKVVGDARIVGLGEGTHGTREFFRVKHRLTRLLAKEKGFTVFAMEASMPEARQVNRYVQTGEGTAREALEHLNITFWQTEEVLALIKWMHAYNASGKGQIVFRGFDMQTPDVAMDSVRTFVRRYDPSYQDTLILKYGAIRSAQEWMQRHSGTPGGNIYEAWHRKAGQVLAHLEDNRQAYFRAGADSSEVAWAVQHARIVRQVASMSLPGEPSRDELMARNVEWIMRHAPPDAKAVLWAHNAHIDEADGSMGRRIAKQYGDDYLTVGFVFHEGHYTARGNEGFSTYTTAPSEAGSIEHVFSRVGPERFVLDLRESDSTQLGSGWLHRQLWHRTIGAVARPWAFTPAVMTDLYDAMVYVEESTPSHMLGK